MRWFWLFLFIPWVLQGELFWQIKEKEIAIEIHIDPSELILGEQLDLQLSLHYPNFLHVNTEALLSPFDSPINPLQPEWKIVKQDISFSALDSEQRINQLIHLTLEPISTGILYLSFLKIFFTNTEGDLPPVEIFTPIFEINVQPPRKVQTSDELATAPLFPLTPQFPINLSLVNRQRIMGPQALVLEAERNQRVFAQRKLPWFSLVIMGFLGLSWLIWKKIEKSRKQAQAQALIVNPKDKALQALEKIQQQNLPKQNLYKEFYIHLIDILRQYLKERFQLSATTQTTDEFLKSVYTSSFFPRESKEILSEILYQADQVKFANYKSSLEDSQNTYRMVREIISKN